MRKTSNKERQIKKDDQKIKQAVIGIKAPAGTDIGDVVNRQTVAALYGAKEESAKQSDRAQKSRKEGALKHAIRKICQSINSTLWPDVEEVILDREKIADLYLTRTDPINIHDIQINKGILTFTSRDGITHSRPVGRIKRILKEIRNGN